MTDLILPAPLREQIERANAAILARSNPGEPPSPAAAPDDKPITDESAPQTREPPPGGEPPAATEEPTEPKKATEQYDPALERNYTSEKELEHADDVEYWKRRFTWLQGKYKAEAQELVPELRSRIESLQAELAEAKQQQATEPSEPPSGQDELSSIRERLVDEFGEEGSEALFELIDSRLRKVNQSTQAAVEASPANAPHPERAAKSLPPGFRDAINRLRPDWEEIDQREDWSEWVVDRDPRSGVSRQALIIACVDANDPQGVASVYNQFLEEVGERPRANAPSGSAEPRAELNERLMPASRGSSVTPQGGRTWTDDDVRAFFREKGKGRYSPEEAEALENDIYAAQREGRYLRQQ